MALILSATDNELRMSDGERKNFPPGTLGYLPRAIHENALKALGNNKWIKLILDMSRSIQACLSKAREACKRLCAYAKKHPYLFTLQIIGVTLVLISICLLPVLGFGAAGPVAGSLAASWQASMGTVAAGSTFAFLQSAAMGGTAAGLFTGMGVTGATAVLGPAALQYAQEISRAAVSTAKNVGEMVGKTSKKVGDVIGDASKKIGGSVSEWMKRKQE